MKSIYLFFCIVILFISMNSCDKINPPYMVSNDQTVDTGSNQGRKVLIEDFTGHHCGNCPAAHELLAQLKAKYNEKLVPISIHAGFFADTIWPGYHIDYRTIEGEELMTAFNIEDNPKGLVNRTVFDNATVLSPESWDAAIENQLEKSVPAHFNILATFQKDTRKLYVQAEAIMLTDQNRNMNLSVYLVEDSLISEQLDYNANPQDIPNYIHRHVFRGSLNGTWGELVSAGKIYKGDIIERNYSMTLPSKYNEKHCGIIVFLSDADTKEVLHVQESDQLLLIE
ncbi:MAG: Omp28 family outer membrane lipoprotein [Bacteroidia bacterium]|nr:Omp28 family outer membrane lipoprotein [Bacteroidia bacterium]